MSLRSGTVLLAAVFVVGCATVGPEESELRIQRAAWQALGIADYDFQMSITCFCVTDVFRDVDIQVRGNLITAIRYADTGQPVDTTAWNPYGTIETLFDRVQDAIDRQAHSLVVEYDPQLHYPRRIEIDLDQQMADEEISYHAKGVTDRRD